MKNDDEIYEEYLFVNEYSIAKLQIQFFGVRCSICDLPYKDDKYKRDIDNGFPLYYYKKSETTYIQFCSCECGLKWQIDFGWCYKDKENKNV